MIVKELIEILKGYPEDMTVGIWFADYQKGKCILREPFPLVDKMTTEEIEIISL